jgi:hypothetical protein
MFSRGAHCREEHADHRDRPQTSMLESPDERGDHGRKGARAIHNDPSAADEEDDGNHFGGRDEAARDDNGSGERANRRLRHAVVGASHDNAPASRRIVAPVEAPRR